MGRIRKIGSAHLYLFTNLISVFNVYTKLETVSLNVLNILMEGIVMNTSNITNYKPKDFAELLGVSVKTLQRWDREGILKAN